MPIWTPDILIILFDVIFSICSQCNSQNETHHHEGDMLKKTLLMRREETSKLHMRSTHLYATWVLQDSFRGSKVTFIKAKVVSLLSLVLCRSYKYFDVHFSNPFFFFVKNRLVSSRFISKWVFPFWPALCSKNAKVLMKGCQSKIHMPCERGPYSDIKMQTIFQKCPGKLLTIFRETFDQGSPVPFHLA